MGFSCFLGMITEEDRELAVEVVALVWMPEEFDLLKLDEGIRFLLLEYGFSFTIVLPNSDTGEGENYPPSQLSSCTPWDI